MRRGIALPYRTVQHSRGGFPPGSGTRHEEVHLSLGLVGWEALVLRTRLRVARLQMARSEGRVYRPSLELLGVGGDNWMGMGNAEDMGDQTVAVVDGGVAAAEVSEPPWG